MVGYLKLDKFGHFVLRMLYIGSVKKCAKTIQQIQQRGLFVEEFISPYLEEFTIDD